MLLTFCVNDLKLFHEIPTTFFPFTPSSSRNASTLFFTPPLTLPPNPPGCLQPTPPAETGKQIDPHSNKEVCDELVKTNKVFGCAKPFKLVRVDSFNYIAVKCDYI